MNDFGKAMYFGLTVKMARNWAYLRKNGVVNWYLFKAVDSYADLAPLPEPQEAGTNFIPVLFLIALIVAAALILRAILRKRK